MKRYYLCDVIGDGDPDVELTPTTGPFRPAVADYGVTWAGTIPSDPVTGHPVHSWALVVVESKDHSEIRKDARIDALPDFPMDGKVSAINAATRSQALAALSRRGIATGVFSNADGYRDVIRGIGRQLHAEFDENKLDVA